MVFELETIARLRKIRKPVTPIEPEKPELPEFEPETIARARLIRQREAFPDFESAIKRVYGPQFAIEAFETLIEDPEKFVKDLRILGKTPETETILSVLGVTPEIIEEFFAEPKAPEIPEEGMQFVEEYEGKRQVFTVRSDYSVEVGGKEIGVYQPETDEIVPREIIALVAPIKRVFPERDVQETIDWAIEDREAFHEAIFEMGRTEDTVTLLKASYPRITDEEIDEFFAEPTKPVSNKFLDGITTGLQYIEGWWKTGLMEAGFALHKGLEIITREENRWTSEAETVMDSAYEKHGWKAIFSDEVNEAWDIYFQERLDVTEPAKIIAELSNPVWWAGAGGLAGLLAKPFTKIPLLGKSLQGVAKGVQATEEVVLAPLTAPIKGGIRFAGKAIGIKPTRPFLADVLPTAAELKSALFKSDTFRKVAQHIPGMKWVAPGTVIEGKLPATLITKPEIEMAVQQEILQRTAIREIGQGTKGQALAYIRELGTTRGILGVKNAMCSPKMVQPRIKGASLALGDVIQAPEQYIFKHKSGFEYCKRAQQICREMYELATKEGIEIHKVGLEPFEEYVHWVCVGKIGKDGVLQMGRRGTRAVGGIVPAMKTRRFENMMDGIKAGYKYADDLEVYVASYVDDMFKAIGDKRLGDGLMEVVPRVEGMLPTKPLDRLIALYPEREIAWTGIRKEMADLGYAWSAIKRVGRGEVLPTTTIRALERRLPEYAEKLATAGTDKKVLRALSKELKTKIDSIKPDWWKARYERSTAMDIVRKPILGREEGMIRTTAGYVHPMFQNQIYPKVIADSATKLLNEEAAAFFRTTAGISAAFRMQIAVLDISAWCIQGLMAQFAHPIKAMRANIGMIEALIKPKVFQQYLVKIAPSMNERMYYLGAQRPFEFFESMGWFVKMAGKVPGGKAVIGQTFGRAQASFSMWATVYKDLMWQANSKHWIKAGQGAEFARYLDRMTGMMSFNQLGMPANVSSFLAGWVSFAPQYRFSVLSWFSHLFKGGMIGTEARKDLAKMVAGATISYVAWCKVTDNPIYLDPYRDGKKFMSINVDGHWIGLGAAVVSMIRASTDIVASALTIGENEPMDFLTLDKWQNPLIRMWYGQSAVLPKLITEIAQRRDYLGYPMESPEDWAKWGAEQITPIWLQDIFFDESGVPVTPTSVLGNFAGLRTSPQTRWETLNDKILALKAWEGVTDLTDEQREKIEGRVFEPGESVLSVLDRYQKAEMFKAFPELVELYEKSTADALNRSSQIRKNYETATTSIKEEAVENLTKAMDVGVKVDGEDTRWLRDRYGEVMKVYGAKSDILRDVEDYQDMFDEWDEAREKRKPEAELVDLAYWEYIEDVVSPDYELPNGDFDFEAYDQALIDFKDKWGEDIYGKISYILENNKAEYPDWAIKLWKDRKELNEGGYWKLPYKLISKMDEDDKAEGNIPEEYLALWEQLQVAEDKDAFIEANPILSKDWRAEFRLGNAEDDAMLALWGYGGKLQTKESYNLVLKWAEALGIPLEQIGLGLPPTNLIDNYFELNKIVAETSGGSIQAKFYKLGHSEYLGYGVEQWGWSDLTDESIDALRIRIDNLDLTTEFDALSDTYEGRELWDKQKEWKASHTEYVDDMRRVKVFELAIDKPEALAFINEFVEYGHEVDKYGPLSAEALLYRHKHDGMNTFGLGENTFSDKGWDELDIERVPIWEINKQWRNEIDWYDNGIPEKHKDITYANEDARNAAIKAERDAFSAGNDDFRKDMRRKEAYELVGPAPSYKKFPVELVETYVNYYEEEIRGYRQERILIKNPAFALAMKDIKGITIPKPSDIPSDKWDKIHEANKQKFEKLWNLNTIGSKHYLPSIPDPEDPNYKNGREYATYVMRYNTDGTITEFYKNEMRLDAYEANVPDKYIENYIAHQKIIKEGKPDDWPDDLPYYEDDWYLQEHLEFHQVLVDSGLLKRLRKFPLVPTREVFRLYQIYQHLDTSRDKMNYRVAHPELDAWGQEKFGWKPAVEQIELEMLSKADIINALTHLYVMSDKEKARISGMSKEDIIDALSDSMKGKVQAYINRGKLTAAEKKAVEKMKESKEMKAEMEGLLSELEKKLARLIK